MKTPKTYTKTFFTNCILKNSSVKTAFYTTIKKLRGECEKQWKAKGSCWTLIVFSSKVINFENFAQTGTITKLFIKVQIWLVQSLGFKVQSSRLLIITSNPLFCLCDFIDLMLSSPILILLVYHSFLILFYLRNLRIDVFVSDTHYFLASHSVSSSLPQKTFSLMVAQKLFYLSWSLRRLSNANVTVLTKVLSFS